MKSFSSVLEEKDVLGNKNSIEKLFIKFLENKCSQEEIRILLDHFNAGDQEGTLRSLILKQLDNDQLHTKENEQAVTEVYHALMDRIDFDSQKVSYPSRLWFGKISRMAAIWIFLLLSTGGLYYFTKKPRHGLPVRMVKVLTKSGERKMVRLNDSSVVWLNSGGSLEYPEIFASNIRSVTLRGEAYFEVSKDRQRPFVIRANKLITRVLGTSFNIRAYAEDSSVSVSVLTGKVDVAEDVAGGKAIQLTPNQQAFYNINNRKLIRKSVNADLIANWKDGKMQFRNQVFGEVIEVLNRKYQVAITYDRRIRECQVFADFDEKDGIEKILQLLMVSMDGKVVRTKDGSYYLQGKGCPD